VYLAGRHIPATSYHHYLGKVKLPFHIPEKELYPLVRRLRLGDLTVANKIIEGHIRLAMQVVGRYLTVLQSRGRKDDLVSEAMLAVSEAVHRAVNKLKDNKITPFIVANIHSKLALYIAEDRVVVVPYITLRRKGDIKLIHPVGLSNNIAATKSWMHGIELRDILENCCVNPIEKELIRLRAKKLTDDEISQSIGMSRPAVVRMRHQIEKRFKELYDGQ